jgi:thiosulfate/3-mercaptopyruvate sulfurtransferase
LVVNPILSMEDLRKQIGDPSLRILDCRFMLQDVNWGENSYREAHIPGAVYADLNKNLSSCVGPKTGRHPLPVEQDFIVFIQSSGISNDSHVVTYDDASGSMAAARLWWLLRAYGFENVQVMDGSFSEWKVAGFPTTNKKTIYPSGLFKGKLNPAWVVGAETVDQSRKDNSRILIDARSHDRFMGQNEVIDHVAGHIPGAVNRPILDNLGVDKKFKPPQKLQEEFRILIGNRPPENIIFYCGSGVTACYNHLALEIAGMHGAKIYPGSWSEWITNPAHEIAVGE